jgi:hypothetical protein
VRLSARAPVRRVGPLDAAVEPFGVLAEDHRVDLGLLDEAAAGAALRMKFSGLPGKLTAGADRDVQVEPLPQADDRAVVDEALVAQFRASSFAAASLGFEVIAPNRPDLVLREQVDRPLGQRVALACIQNSQPMSAWT